MANAHPENIYVEDSLGTFWYAVIVSGSGPLPREVIYYEDIRCDPLTAGTPAPGQLTPMVSTIGSITGNSLNKDVEVQFLMDQGAANALVYAVYLHDEAGAAPSVSFFSDTSLSSAYVPVGTLVPFSASAASSSTQSNTASVLYDSGNANAPVFLKYLIDDTGTAVITFFSDAALTSAVVPTGTLVPIAATSISSQVQAYEDLGNGNAPVFVQYEFNSDGSAGNTSFFSDAALTTGVIPSGLLVPVKSTFTAATSNSNEVVVYEDTGNANALVYTLYTIGSSGSIISVGSFSNSGLSTVVVPVGPLRIPNDAFIADPSSSAHVATLQDTTDDSPVYAKYESNGSGGLVRTYYSNASLTTVITPSDANLKPYSEPLSAVADDVNFFSRVLSDTGNADATVYALYSKTDQAGAVAVALFSNAEMTSVVVPVGPLVPFIEPTAAAASLQPYTELFYSHISSGVQKITRVYDVLGTSFTDYDELGVELVTVGVLGTDYFISESPRAFLITTAVKTNTTTIFDNIIAVYTTAMQYMEIYADSGDVSIRIGGAGSNYIRTLQSGGTMILNGQAEIEDVAVAKLAAAPNASLNVAIFNAKPEAI